MLKRLREEDMNNMVDHPPHYNATSIETIDMIGSVTGDGFEFYLQGNIMKYLCRYPYKNGVEDLEKARWYLNKLIKIKKGKRMSSNMLPTSYQEFIHKSRYARWLEEEGRRENWGETVSRYVDFMEKLCWKSTTTKLKKAISKPLKNI